jgi:hypothetical protein
MKHSKICVLNMLTEIGVGVDRVENVRSSGFGKDPSIASVVKYLVLTFLCPVWTFENLKQKFRPV